MGVTQTRLSAIVKRVCHSFVCLLVFAGRIPTELGRLTALKELYLHNNQPIGGVTQTCFIAIGKGVYHSITRLSACFSGSIPTELGQLTALKELYLHNTQLTGETQLARLQLVNEFTTPSHVCLRASQVPPQPSLDS